MKRSMTGVEVGAATGITAGIAAGIAAGISTAIVRPLAGEYFFHTAPDASTDKSALLRPAPGTKKEGKVPGEERDAPGTVTMLKAQYGEREVVSFDQLRLHGYLYRREKPNKKWAVLIHGYGDSGMWFGKEALVFYQAGFNLLLPDAKGHGKNRGAYVGMGWHDRLGIKEWICWFMRQYPDSEVVLYGVSIGAAAVMMVAGEELPSNVKAAVKSRSYTSA